VERAAKNLGESPTDRVACPECARGTLAVVGVPWSDGAHADRHLVCSTCGARDVLGKLVS
jgi:DNA-directed RNA polymerase subunit RPC12/RpoP